MVHVLVDNMSWVQIKERFWQFWLRILIIMVDVLVKPIHFLGILNNHTIFCCFLFRWARRVLLFLQQTSIKFIVFALYGSTIRDHHRSRSGIIYLIINGAVVLFEPARTLLPLHCGQRSFTQSSSWVVLLPTVVHWEHSVTCVVTARLRHHYTRVNKLLNSYA